MRGIFIFILRKKKTGDEIMGYRIKWFPLIPVIFILMMLGVTANVIMSDWKNSLIGLIVMLCGYPIYLALKSVNKKSQHA